MKITLRLFARAKEVAAADTLELELPDGATVAELRVALAERLPECAGLAEHIRFAINAEFATDASPLAEQDDVACIPPVSGG